MKTFFFLLSLIAVTGVFRADLRSEIMAARRRVDKAVVAKDVKGAEAAYREAVTPDFKYVQQGKTQDFKQFIENFKASMTMTERVTTSTTRIISLKETASGASGDIEMGMTGTMRTPDKKSHFIKYIGVFTEEYRKVGGKWKLAVMTAGPQKFLMDGKPVKF